MKKIIFIFTALMTLIILVSSCNNYENKTHYELKIGETFELYLDQNSCCQNCFINESSIKTIKFISDTLVDRGRKNCAGCSSTIAWIFKAINKGTDTIKIQRISMGERCDSIKIRPTSTYIITVK